MVYIWDPLNQIDVIRWTISTWLYMVGWVVTKMILQLIPMTNTFCLRGDRNIPYG